MGRKRASEREWEPSVTYLSYASSQNGIRNYDFENRGAERPILQAMNEFSANSSHEALGSGYLCLVITSTTNEEINSMPDISSINGNKIGQDALQQIHGLLRNFFQQQINIFCNESLMIFDDFEKPIKLDLKIPDFNLLNFFTDLREVLTFKLYTKESGDEFHILRVNNQTALKESNFNNERHTYIITHGFATSSDGPSCTLVRYALQNTTDSNIITVNWSPLANGFYEVARLFVPRVGKYIGKLINILYKNGMKPEATTLIGHSLGAHVMGIAGQTLNEKVNHTIGLDPAWPLFFAVSANDRLSPDDALHVEVIHTDAGLLGYPFNLGLYDFYPNGGFLQPGCHNDFFSACSHGRSYRYLAEQISNPGPDFCSLNCISYLQFIEKKCTNETTFMGGIRSYPANQGTYYLKTNDTEPFGLRTQCA
ncbi:pancreatic triacylglycerol lipase-like [Belonocnema kinseyi]|uniref:pancreatic triacylglycerol lipase-like n=1 Tax=Belonocnema kinseyi TaxID=2817044 RepID=UPI00143D6DD1|nr:pancreatic triacylglycerol lipase-like [Belonocnema kinseyi]